MAAPTTEHRSLGHYRLLKLVGSGGMGEVYLAHDEHLNRDVAVKLLRSERLADPAQRERLRQEALTLSRINHPNIATIYDFGEDSGEQYFVTEFVDGPNLTERLRQGPLSPGEVVELGIELADGLAAAHGLGIVHRDLKPANLRLTSGGRLKILDFGLAESVPQVSKESTVDTAVVSGEIAGTMMYMAPERLRGVPADARSDIYSAGAVLYEMTTARTVCDSATLGALVDSILHKPAVPPSVWTPYISRRLERVILRCLEKKPERRYEDAQQLLADLRRVAQFSTADDEKSVAVMYFEHLSQDKDDEYFRDGVTEDITTELAKIKELRVFSRSATLTYKDKPVTPQYVGQQLGASHVLEGSVRRAAGRLRITARLVATQSGLTVWAEKYDRRMEDVFEVQDEIAHSIASALQVMLTEREQAAIEKVPTADVRAYDSYLRGRQFFHQFRRRGFDIAREMFQRAIELDPSFARAYAGIADCNAFTYIYWESSDAFLEQAEQASLKALELDPELAEAHASRGLVASLRKRYDEAQSEFEKAIRLNPRLFEAYYFAARSFYAQGKHEQAVEWFEHASDVSPESYQALMLMASALHGLGRETEAQAAYARGLHAAERHLEAYPSDARALYFGANALTQLKETERALDWAGRALRLEPDEHQVLYNVACVYALLGHTDEALDCLERSVTHGWGQREWMEHDPDLTNLREEPRFQQIVHGGRA